MSLDNPGTGPIDNSYIIDPFFARRFTAGWTGLLGCFVVLSAPKVYRSFRSGRIWQGVGFRENARAYESLGQRPAERAAQPPSRTSKAIGALRALVHGPTLFSLPKTQLDLGQIFIIITYYAILLITLLIRSDLRVNSNRAGFLALAQLTPVFAFGTKNNPLAFLLGRGYEKFNVLHRWSGRGILLMATVHGSLWINQYLKAGQADYLKQSKPRLGMAAYGTLCMLTLLSLRPFRQRFYQLFFISHVITFVTFFVLICYHTPYSRPWIFPPIAFYGLDLALRLFRYRIKDAILESRDTQMTLVHIPDVMSGWIAGQHVQLRVFFGYRFYESHSFTIINAPRSISTMPSRYESGDGPYPGGITLGARVSGDWTKALNELAQRGEKGRERVTVLLDGPYGGSTIDLGEFETVLLISGGSGITFALGMLDDLVGRVVKLGRPNGERTTKVQFVWCMRSFGAIHWFAPMLMYLGQAAQGSSISISFLFFVTCLCDPEAIPAIPNTTVSISKPVIGDLVDALLSSPNAGGIGISASGPESLTRGTQNAVAKIGSKRAASVGGVELHTELFAM